MPVVSAVSRSAQEKRVVEEASKLAKAFEEEFRIVHVLKTSEFVEMESSNVQNSGKPVEMDEVRMHAAQIAETAAEGVTENFKAVGLIGNPAKQIIKYANEHDASYIVVGGRKRSPTGKVLFGSVTQSILLGVDRPVLSVMESGK